MRWNLKEAVSKDNLNTAYLQVVRNKGAAGVDGMTVEELGAYLSENGENIREQLRTRKHKPQPVRRVEIPKPDGGVRNLGAPTVADRFIQQAVAQILTPIFEERFHDHGYGFRPNRRAQFRLSIPSCLMPELFMSLTNTKTRTMKSWITGFSSIFLLYFWK